MLTIHVENIGDLAVIECKGRIIRSDSVFNLRDITLAQEDSRIIVMDLSEVETIGGGGLGMLAFSNAGRAIIIFSSNSSIPRRRSWMGW